MDAHDWDQRYAEHELVWSAEPNRFVAEELADLPPGRALDLAAGEGRNAIWLARRGWQVTAVDFSRVGLDKGRQLAGGLAEGLPVEWVCADATRWLDDHADRAGGADLVVVAYLQLPPAQRRAAVRSAWGSLRAGGTLLWVAHDRSNLTEGTGGPQDPTVLMTAEDLLADLAALGERPEVLRAGRVTREVEPGHGADPARTAYDCLLRARRG